MQNAYNPSFNKGDIIKAKRADIDIVYMVTDVEVENDLFCNLYLYTLLSLCKDARDMVADIATTDFHFVKVA